MFVAHFVLFSESEVIIFGMGCNKKKGRIESETKKCVEETEK